MRKTQPDRTLVQGSIRLKPNYFFNSNPRPKGRSYTIVSEIEKLFSEADNLEKAIDESLGKSEALRQSILKQLFEGSLTQITTTE